MPFDVFILDGDERGPSVACICADSFTDWIAADGGTDLRFYVQSAPNGRWCRYSRPVQRLVAHVHFTRGHEFMVVEKGQLFPSSQEPKANG